MNPYRIKHIPTGLYYKPEGNTCNNLSKTGKVYFTKINVLNTGVYNIDGKEYIGIHVKAQSPIHMQTLPVIDWRESYTSKKRYAYVPVDDFKIEEININD